MTWHDITSHDMSQLTTLPHLTSPHNRPDYFISPRNQLHDIITHHITTMERLKARSPQKVGLGILWLIVFSLSKLRLARLYLVVWYLIVLFDRMQTSLPWWDGSPNSKHLVDLNSNGSSLKSKVETKISGLGAGVGAKSTHHVFWWSFLTVIMHFPPSGVDKAWSKPDSMFEVNLWRWRGAK